MVFDWVESYVEATAAMPSPEPFRLWSAITAISGVLERKVFTTGSARPIYPNLFTLLIGPPASGKTNAINVTRDLWSKIQGLNLSPDNVTKAALIDVFSRSMRTVIHEDGSATIFSSLTLPCSEFGVFFPHHDLEFLSVLTTFYDNPEHYREERRTTGVIEINKPYLTILAGTQPNFLSSFLPEEAWGQGFTSRLIMIYAEAAPILDLFATVEINSELLLRKLTEIFSYKGQFVWTKNAAEEINAWNRQGCPPSPTHSKLTIGYNGRRPLHTIKLSMISAASRCDGQMTVTVEDFERAKDWLLQAEIKMPDIFHAMGAKSDAQLIADLHFHLYKLWSSIALDKRKPLPVKHIYEFLHTRVPSDRIGKLIEVAERTGYIKRGAYPDEWIPCVKTPGGFGNM